MVRGWEIITYLAALLPVGAAFAAATAPSSQPAAGSVQMIFWEEQSWSPNGSSTRLTLWADGRSEIMLRLFGPALKTNPGWVASKDNNFTRYRKSNPLPTDQAIQKFNAAVDAGITKLKTFPAGYNDGVGTLVGVEIDGKTKQTVIPEFMFPDQPDNQGSENHKRYLAVKKALGDFSADAIAREPGHDHH